MDPVYVWISRLSGSVSTPLLCMEFSFTKKKTLHYLGILDESKVKLEESSFNYNQLV